MGNIGSLSNAIYSQGWDPILISSPLEVNDISHLIIPGVGAYDSAMNLLSKKKINYFCE
jgi:glutamine amidotransferase